MEKPVQQLQDAAQIALASAVDSVISPGYVLVKKEDIARLKTASENLLGDLSEEISNDDLFSLLPTIQFRDEKPLPAVWLTRKDAYAFARAAIKFLHQAKAEGCSEPPAAPPECKTEAEKTAFAFGWFKALEASRLKQQCWCTTCRPVTPQDMRFVVCPDCGNKRCPKANDHRNACTGSNDVGQAGSSWEHVKPVDHPKGENE